MSIWFIINMARTIIVVVGLFDLVDLISPKNILRIHFANKGWGEIDRGRDGLTVRSGENKFPKYMRRTNLTPPYPAGGDVGGWYSPNLSAVLFR